MPRLLVISILGTEDMLRPDLFTGHADGEHDAEWLCRRLEEAGTARPEHLVRVDVCRGEKLPSHDDVDVVVVGGSYHNANEGRDWQLVTIDWLRGWRDTGRPYLGICGGHQLAAVALGGSVARMDVGPWAGTAPVTLTEEGRRHYLFEGLGGAPQVHLGHYDHVDRPPAGAVMLAERDGVIQALDFGGDWLGVQFHPECSDTLMEHAWDGELGDMAGAYRPSRDGSRMLVNFLRAHGVLPAADEPPRRVAR